MILLRVSSELHEWVRLSSSLFIPHILVCVLFFLVSFHV